MKDLEDQYHDLVHKLALQRAAERMLLGFIAVCVVGIAGLFFFQSRKLDTEIRYQQQAAASREKFIASNTEQLHAQTDQIESYLQCLGDFFAQPNRQNVTIENLQQCQLNVNAFSPTSATVVIPKQTTAPVAKTPTTSAPPKSPTPSASSSTTQTSQGQASSGSGTSQPGLIERIAQNMVGMPRRLIGAMSGLL